MADEKETTNDNGTPPESDGKPPADTGNAKPPAKEGTSDTGGSGSGDGDIRSIVAEEVKKALDGLRAPGSTLPTPRARDIEEEAKRMVREAAEKLEAEKAHENEHKELAEKAKDLTENAPKKVRKLTKALWGDQE